MESDIGVDPKQKILVRPSFQGIAGDTHSILKDAYPLLGGSILGRESNAVTFQKQLADIDSELAKFEAIMGLSTLDITGPSVGPVNALPLTNGPVLSLGLAQTPSRPQGNGKGQLMLSDQAQQVTSNDDLTC